MRRVSLRLRMTRIAHNVPTLVGEGLAPPENYFSESFFDSLIFDDIEQ